MKTVWLDRLLLIVGLALFCIGGVRVSPDHRAYDIAPYVPWSFLLGLLLLCVSGVRYWARMEMEQVLQRNRDRTWQVWLSTFPERREQ